MNIGIFGEVLLKLCMAMMVGGVIGWDRQRERKPAGMRTHMLVCLGSTMFVIMPIYSPVSMTVSQVIQGVIQGIGFLGAGEIIRRTESRKGQGVEVVHGLTSAATIWVVAALGVAIALGLYAIALVGMGLVWLTLRVGLVLEQKLFQDPD
jgi:putative Mg2+ transporter-C (MgtC) family protein